MHFLYKCAEIIPAKELCGHAAGQDLFGVLCRIGKKNGGSRRGAEAQRGDRGIKGKDRVNLKYSIIIDMIKTMSFDLFSVSSASLCETCFFIL